MTATTAPVPRPCDRPHGHHDRVRVLVEVDTFNDRAREPTRVLPYALVPHPALPPGSKPSNSSEPKNKAGCTRGSPPTTPTDQAEERLKCHTVVRRSHHASRAWRAWLSVEVLFLRRRAWWTRSTL